MNEIETVTANNKAPPVFCFIVIIVKIVRFPTLSINFGLTRMAG